MLLAIGFSGVCLSVTLLGVWTSTRRDSFLLTWAAGVMLLVGHVLAYWAYAQTPSILLLAGLMAFLAAGLAGLYGAARQFCGGHSPLRPALAGSGTIVALETPLLISGYDGAAMMVENFGAFAILCMTAWVYYRHRADAPVPMIALAAMYTACGISFALCGMMLVLDRQWIIGHAPKNWAEDFSIVAAVAPPKMMIAAPNMQITAPTVSQRSGRLPSTTHIQTRDARM